MPTNCNETTWERYQREHEEYLAMLAKFSPKDIFALQHQLHNALALLEESVRLLTACERHSNELFQDTGDREYMLASDAARDFLERVEKEVK